MADSIVPSSAPFDLVLKQDRQPDFHLIDLGRRLSDQLRAMWGEKPRYYKEIVDSVWLQPLIGGSSTVAASLGAGHVFLATANPATLMPIGAGVGSAVMGKTGIVAQAAFLPAGTALIPVLAPIMAFLTFSSMTTSVALKRVQRSLDELYRDRRAGDLASLKRDDESLREVASQYAQGQVFTPAMIDQLGRSRDRIRVLHGKYEELLPQWLFGKGKPGDGPLDRTQIAFFAAARLLNLRADFLRLYLTYQDDREHAEGLQEDLLRSFADCRTPFRRLRKHQRDVRRQLEEKRWLKGGLTGEDRELEAILKLAVVKECARRRELTRGSKSMLLLQTGGGDGALKAYVTHDPRLEQAARVEVVPRKTLDLARSHELDESKQKEVDMSPGRREASEERAGSAIASFRSELKTRLAAIDGRLSATEGRFSKVDREVAGVSGKMDDLCDKLVTRVEASERQVKSEISSFQGEVRTRFTEIDARFNHVDASFGARLDEVKARFDTVDSEFTRAREERADVRAETMAALKRLDDRQKVLDRRLRLIVWLAGGLTLGVAATVLMAVFL